jgi:ankyrin repeat protein
MNTPQPSTEALMSPVLSVDAWRTMDAICTADCTRYIDRVARAGMTANLDTAIAAGCVHRGSYSGRFNIIAKAVASSGDLMIDEGARWLDKFTHPDADVKFNDGFGVVNVLNASLLESVAYGDVALPWIKLLVAAGADPYFSVSGDMNRCALISALHENPSSAIVRFFLEKEEAFDENHPLPVLRGNQNIFVEAAHDSLNNFYRYEVFREIELKIAPGYMAPYYDLFDTVLSIIGNHKFPNYRSEVRMVAELIALGATPREAEKEEAWKMVMSTLMPAKLVTHDGNQATTSTSNISNVPFSHAVLTLDLGVHVKTILRRLLEEGGLDVEQGTSDGATPLLRAAAQGILEGVDALLDLGADSSARVAGLHKQHADKLCDAAEIAESHGHLGIAPKIRAHQAKMAIQKVIDRVVAAASSCQ